MPNRQDRDTLTRNNLIKEFENKVFPKRTLLHSRTLAKK